MKVEELINKPWEQVIKQLSDPWEVDIVELTDKYLDFLNKAKELDLKIAADFILIAVFLLKMKLMALENKEEETVEETYNVVVEEDIEEFDLKPKVPLPRKRRIKLQELIEILKKVLERPKKERKKLETKKLEIKKPKESIMDRIKKVYKRIIELLKREKRIGLFSHLVPTKERKDIINTFVPLLHLSNKGVIKLDQEEIFGEIYVEKKD